MRCSWLRPFSVTNDRPEAMEFLTFDSRLGTAADAEGFRVVGTELD